MLAGAKKDGRRVGGVLDGRDVAILKSEKAGIATPYDPLSQISSPPYLQIQQVLAPSTLDFPSIALATSLEIDYALTAI